MSNEFVYLSKRMKDGSRIKMKVLASDADRLLDDKRYSRDFVRGSDVNKGKDDDAGKGKDKGKDDDAGKDKGKDDASKGKDKE